MHKKKVVFQLIVKGSAVITLLLITGMFGCLSGCIGNQETKVIAGNESPVSMITVTDCQNNTVSLQHPANRIVTTSYYAAEYLVVLGAGDQIIGVNERIKENPLFSGQLNNAQVIGSDTTPDIEKITALNPDVVLLPVETSSSVRSQFHNTGLNVAYFDYYSLSEVPFTIRSLGKMTGKEENAERYLNFYTTYDDLISERLENVTPDEEPTVYYEMGSDYSTAGKGSGGYNYLQKVKGDNIAGDLDVSYPVVSPEWIVAKDPQVLIKICDQAATNSSLSTTFANLKGRSGFSDIHAIKDNRSYIVSTNILYGPRQIVGLLTLAKICYPDRFADIDPDSILDRYAEQFFNNSSKTETVYPTISIPE